MTLKIAQLQNKKHLDTLLLKFNLEEGRMVDDNDALVLESLAPPPCLQSLEIHNYRGSTVFPNWMMSLAKLRLVVLSDCISWEQLPPLGKLPFLESLTKWHGESEENRNFWG